MRLFPACTGGSPNENAQLRAVGRLYMVVEYSSSANTHPVGVRRAVPGLPPNEEYGVHPRICSNHLTGSGNSVPVRVSIACANSGTCLELIVSLPNASCRRLWHRQRAWSWISRLYLIGGTESGRIFPFTHPHSDKRNHAPFIHTTSFG